MHPPAPCTSRPFLRACFLPVPRPISSSLSALLTAFDAPAPPCTSRIHYSRLPLPVHASTSVAFARMLPTCGSESLSRARVSRVSLATQHQIRGARYAVGEWPRVTLPLTPGRVQETRRAARPTSVRQTARAHRHMGVAALPAPRARPAPSLVANARGTRRKTRRGIRRIAGLHAACCLPSAVSRQPPANAVDRAEGPPVRRPAERGHTQSREGPQRTLVERARFTHHARGGLLSLGSATRARPLPYACAICAHARYCPLVDGRAHALPARGARRRPLSLGVLIRVRACAVSRERRAAGRPACACGKRGEVMRQGIELRTWARRAETRRARGKMRDRTTRAASGNGVRDGRLSANAARAGAERVVAHARTRSGIRRTDATGITQTVRGPG
ncbi:hypothetical protein IEO21_09700 [Rhodonia placenta]|uniref:Uncharacterized protein n=1 Tax=Rhodonia placenta TaxID=104341 RepID=A0A8H7NTY5_9APHY|nr:hypothetical protein IEO21_09700 [Postia placenta]